MKTKIKTLLAICILGFIGIININATVDYKKTTNAEVIEEGKTLKNESNKTDEGLLTAIEKTTSLESDAKAESVEFLLNEDADAKIDFQKEAQSVTKWIVDQAEAKVVQKLISDGKLNESK